MIPNIESLVTNRETSRRLKDLGVAQISAFCYTETDEDPYWIAAFTATELAVMRPDTLGSYNPNKMADFIINGIEKKWLNIEVLNDNLKRFWKGK